jgi:hypothetical protein
MLSPPSARKALVFGTMDLEFEQRGEEFIVPLFQLLQSIMSDVELNGLADGMAGTCKFETDNRIRSNQAVATDLPIVSNIIGRTILSKPARLIHICEAVGGPFEPQVLTNGDARN